MTRRLGSGPVTDALVVLGTFLVLGGICGVVWALVVDPAHLVQTRAGLQAPSELELSKRFDADGWYSVIAVVAGFLSGLGLSWWRSRNALLTTLLLLPGAALAAAVMAMAGHALGPGDPGGAIEGAARGSLVPLELVVTARASYLMWPVAVLFGALMVLWSAPRLPEDQGGAPSPGVSGGDLREPTQNAGHAPR